MTDEDERMLKAGRYEDNWHLICVVLGEHPDAPVEQLVAQIHAIRGEARRSADAYERGRQDAALRCWELADMYEENREGRVGEEIRREFNLDGMQASREVLSKAWRRVAE